MLRIFFIFSNLSFFQFRLTRLVKNYCFVHLFKYLCIIYLISRCPLSTRWSFSNSSSSSAPHDSVASSDLLSGNLFNFRNNYLLLLTKPVFKEVCMCVLLFFFSSRRRHTRCREVSWARRCV